MRVYTAFWLTLLFCFPAAAQKTKRIVPRPTQFEIGVLTFFDFGPPFDYYSLYIVRPAESGAHLERLLLTPQADRCFSPAKLEKSEVQLTETIDQLLGTKNPCEIPEKELKRELRRCKRCVTFSGANVTMQTNCSGETRLIRSDILDRDMFDPAAKTPQNTDWTMGLLSKLEKAAGPGVMEKPMFPITQDLSTPPVKEEDGAILKAMEDGSFDKLFPSRSLRVSELYKQTQLARLAHPEVTIKEIKPRAPENLVLPNYPPISLLVHAQGSVTANFTILDDGTPSVLPRLAGNRLLQGVVIDAIKNWRFPKDAAGEEIEATFEFTLNCPKETAGN